MAPLLLLVLVVGAVTMFVVGLVWWIGQSWMTESSSRAPL